MRTDHRPTPQDFRYAVLPDWQPAPWPRWAKALVLLAGSLIAWSTVLAFIILVHWAIHHGG